MRQPHLKHWRRALGLGALTLACYAQAQVSSDQNLPPAVARQQAAEVAQGDPARWYQEDVTPEMKLRTLRKEIAAGLQENLGACKSLPAPERRSCQQEARAIYQQDMAKARAQAMATR